MSDRPWPRELRFQREARRLLVVFDNADDASIPFELLRVESPSAEVQGHGGRDKRLIAGKKNVGVSDAELVGDYAVRIIFDDGHDTGLFTWDYLAKLGSHRDELMAAYEARLTEAHMSRDA